MATEKTFKGIKQLKWGGTGENPGLALNNYLAFIRNESNGQTEVWFNGKKYGNTTDETVSAKLDALLNNGSTDEATGSLGYVIDEDGKWTGFDVAYTIINNSNSLSDAFEKLDEAIRVEIDRATVLEGRIEALENIEPVIYKGDGITITEDITTPGEVKFSVGNITMGQVTDLTSTIGDLVDDVDALETVVGDSTSGLVKDVADNKTAIEGEVTRATAAEVALGARINELEGQTIAGVGAIGTETVSGDTEISLKIDANDKILSQTTDGILSTINLVKTNDLTYQLQDKNGDPIGDTINIPKDQFLISAEIVTDPVGQPAGKYLKLTFQTTTGEDITYIGLNDLVDVYTGGNGINIDGSNVVSVKLDPTSDAYLTIGTDGVKLSGVQTALDLKANVSDLTTHTTNINNPHGVTKEQVGLGNVDNTSDLNKPVSTATQTALDTKVDKEAGKGLSTNDYSNADKAIVDGVATTYATKGELTAEATARTNADTALENNKVDKTTTVNAKALGSDIVLDGRDIKLDGYTKPASTGAIDPDDTVNVALGKLEKGLEDAVAGGVTSIVQGDGIEVNSNISTKPVVSVKRTDDAKNALKVEASGVNVMVNTEAGLEVTATGIGVKLHEDSPFAFDTTNGAIYMFYETDEE